jgi:hypothetical protein
MIEHKIFFWYNLSKINMRCCFMQFVVHFNLLQKFNYFYVIIFTQNFLIYVTMKYPPILYFCIRCTVDSNSPRIPLGQRTQ